MRGALCKLLMVPSMLILLVLTGCLHLGVGEKSQEFPATATSSVQGDKKSELENRRVYIATEALIAGHPSEEEMVFSYRLTPWYEGRRAACSLTFDDGTVDQYQVAFPLLRERDMRGSFYILTGFRDLGVWKDGMIKRRLFSWEAARKIAAAGNEIGSHGVTHRDLRAIYRAGRGEDVIRELRLSAGHIINRIEQEY